MSDVALGAAFRAVRRRRGLRQVDAARMGRTSPSTVSRIERGRVDDVSLRVLRRVANELEIDLRLTARWRGGELGRLVNERHALLHDAALALVGVLPAWRVAPEVSFSVWGERGRGRPAWLARADEDAAGRAAAAGAAAGRERQSGRAAAADAADGGSDPSGE